VASIRRETSPRTGRGSCIAAVGDAVFEHLGDPASTALCYVKEIGS
jgi:hypothetical protein